MTHHYVKPGIFSLIKMLDQVKKNGGNVQAAYKSLYDTLYASSTETVRSVYMTMHYKKELTSAEHDAEGICEKILKTRPDADPRASHFVGLLEVLAEDGWF